MEIKRNEDIKNYIDVEKVTEKDLLVFKINIDTISGEHPFTQIEKVVSDVKKVLDELNIKALFIPQHLGTEMEILPLEGLDNSRLLEIYATQQGNAGFSEGYIKSLSDFENENPYNDGVDSKNEHYTEKYKLGYSMAWNYNLEKQKED
jgi:hypothetical protein